MLLTYQCGGFQWYRHLTIAELLAAARHQAAERAPHPIVEEARRRAAERGAKGLAAIVGQWPGDETDEEIQRTLDEIS